MQPITFARRPPLGRKAGSLSNLSGWKSACIVSLFCAATAIVSPAQVAFKTLVNFDGSNGSAPFLMSLLQGPDGSLYGTTPGGGTIGDGTVFTMTPGGALTTLYDFSGPDGSTPFVGLILAADGNFYGTTDHGGAYGFGTVFRITPGGTLTTLYSFCARSKCPDGDAPDSGLVQGDNGDFYGTTQVGGAYGKGTVFRITSAGVLSTMYSFCAEFPCADGADPLGLLAVGSDGNFYGTTSVGGSGKCAGNGCGTIFKITPAGTLTTLHAFAVTDGVTPIGGLVQGSNGIFYGATQQGGTDNHGTVFEITSGGTLTTLHSFDTTDGAGPNGGLVQASDGSLYGTTAGGGANGYGSLFKVTSGGTVTTLHSFCAQTNCPDGSYPPAGLAQATNGTFYGTTAAGGVSNDGTIFGLSVGLGRFVKTVPTSGAVGSLVTILGYNLTGATGVSFNSTAATFTVVSDTEITTAVPTGATTGQVQVTFATGALSSNAVFRVHP